MGPQKPTTQATALGRAALPAPEYVRGHAKEKREMPAPDVRNDGLAKHLVSKQLPSAARTHCGFALHLFVASIGEAELTPIFGCSFSRHSLTLP